MERSWLRIALPFCIMAGLARTQVQSPKAVENAIGAFQRGELKTAEIDLRDYLQAAPKDAVALGFLGVVLDQEQKYAQAEDAYRGALAISRSPQLLNNYANHLVASGRPSEARPIFFEVLTLDPNHANALRQLASIAMQQKHPAEAVRYLKRIPVEDRGKDWDFELGVASASAGDKATAMQALVRARQADPTRADVESLLARTAAELGYFGDAVEAWDSYLKLSPGNATAIRERAFDESAIGQNMESALVDLRAFVGANPQDPVGHYELGTAEAASDSSAAKKEFDAAIELRPGFAPAYFARGLLLYREGQMQAALADYQAAAKTEPNSAVILDHMGEVYLALNQDQNALRVLRKAAQLAPKNTVVLLHLGRALSKTGEQRESAAVFAKYRELGGSKQGLPHPAGLLDYLSLPPEEQMARYRAGVERTVQNDPQNVEAQTRLLSLLLADGDAGRAASVAWAIAALKPALSVVSDVKRELTAAGQYETAREFARRASASH